MKTEELTWSLAMATYERRDVLEDCIECVLNQTALPSDIVIVDGSADWIGSKKQLEKKFPRLLSLEYTYVPAEVKSAASQRNQAAALCRGDVLFFIDDDTMMYPDCAQNIMDIYRSDLKKNIVAKPKSCAST